jgi:transposase
MFSYVALEDRIPADHPLRGVRKLVDTVLAGMSKDFDGLYAKVGRPSIPPERLLRALLLQVFYSVRSERLLMEQLNYNLLFRWFVGLEIDDEVWNHAVFSKNRDRLLNQDLAQRFFARVKEQAAGLMSDEHFTVDGTLIQAWASRRSFVPKPDPPAPGGGSGVKGEVLVRDRTESATDAEARLYKKSQADKSVPCYQGHALMDNRHGLVVEAEASQAGRDSEREAALRMLDRTRKGKHATLGADTGYQEPRFVEALRRRGIAPHVSEYVNGNLGKNGLNEQERTDPRRLISQRKRKLIEETFGWAKLTGLLRQVKLRGLKRVDWFYRLVMVGYNLVRMRKLIPIPA